MRIYAGMALVHKRIERATKRAEARKKRKKKPTARELLWRYKMKKAGLI